MWFGVSDSVVIVFSNVWRLIMACFHAQVNLRSLQMELQGLSWYHGSVLCTGCLTFTCTHLDNVARIWRCLTNDTSLLWRNYSKPCTVPYLKVSTQGFFYVHWWQKVMGQALFYSYLVTISDIKSVVFLTGCLLYYACKVSWGGVNFCIKWVFVWAAWYPRKGAVLNEALSKSFLFD